MTDMNDDALLAELGLTGNAETTATETAGAATATPKAEKQKRVEIKIATVSTGVAALLPDQARGGGGFGEREQKYPFKELAAPAKDEAGNVTGYAFFEVLLADTDADAKKLRGAVQAAVAAANKKAKEDNEPQRFVSRTKLDADGAYVGSQVYRVDDTQDEDPETPAE